MEINTNHHNHNHNHHHWLFRIRLYVRLIHLYNLHTRHIYPRLGCIRFHQSMQTDCWSTLQLINNYMHNHFMLPYYLICCKIRPRDAVRWKSCHLYISIWLHHKVVFSAEWSKGSHHKKTVKLGKKSKLPWPPCQLGNP